MPYVFHDHEPLPVLSEEADRLRHLARDLDALSAGQQPDPALLTQAPTLEDWSLTERPSVCLFGMAFGHPTIRGGNFVRTSDLWVLAPRYGFARTLSRFYRLRDPGSHTP